MKRTAPDWDTKNRSNSERRAGSEERSRPSKAVPQPVETLQQSAGNQAVRQLHLTGAMQESLSVTQPNDSREREAQRVAERVTQMGTAPKQTTEGDGENGTDREVPAGAKLAVRSATGTEVPAETASTLRDGIQGRGKPLPKETRLNFESRLGEDFSGVRIHTDTAADAAAQSISAEAYTMGSNIAFADGNYDTESEAGKKLLAHELTHVAQRSGSSHAPRTVQRQDDGGTSASDVTGAASNLADVAETGWNILKDGEPTSEMHSNSASAMPEDLNEEDVMRHYREMGPITIRLLRALVPWESVALQVSWGVEFYCDGTYIGNASVWGTVEDIDWAQNVNMRVESWEAIMMNDVAKLDGNVRITWGNFLQGGDYLFDLDLWGDGSGSIRERSGSQ